MKYLLKEADYHYRKLYSWQSLSFFYSPYFRRAFIFAFLLHFPFLFFYSAGHKKIVEPKTITVALQNVQRTKIQNLDHLDSQTKKTENTQEPIKNQEEQKSEKHMEKNPSKILPDIETDNSFQSEFEKQIFSPNKKTSAPVPKTNTVKTPKPTWEIPQGQTQTQVKEKETLPTASENQGGKKESGRVRWQGGHSRKTLYLPQVKYPAYYLSKGIQAKGIFSIEIDAGGSVIGVSTLKSTGYPGLDVEAKNALRAARFSVIEDMLRIDRGEIDVEFKLK